MRHLRGGDWITPNVSSIVENTSAKFEPVQIPVIFYIDEESYTIPYPMTWKEVIDNPNFVTCNTDVGDYGHYFDPVPHMNCDTDESLYYNEEDGRILSDYCSECWHVAPNPCRNWVTMYLIDDKDNIVDINHKIKSLKYSLQEIE